MATRTPLILNQVTARVEELSVGDIIPGTFVEGYTGKNALINGDFSIWQRGTNFTAPGYTADRWTFNAGGVASPNVWRNTMTPQQFPGVNAPALARVSYGAITDAAAHFVVFEQLIEDVSTFAAETVSMQFYVYNSGAAGRQISVEFRQGFGVGGSSTVDSLGVKKFTLAAGLNFCTHTFTLPSVSGKTAGANNSLACTFWVSAGSNWNTRSGSLGSQTGDVHFTQVQLESGSTATGFERRHPAIELVMCQRYYEKSYNLSDTPGASVNQGREAHAYTGVQANTGWATVRFSQRKRTTPAVTIYPANTSGGSPGNVAQNDGSITGAAVENAGSYGVQVAWSNQAGKFGAWFHWVADAEI
ncbi:hypothetical protein J3A72_003174 [Stenotrophomonas sp. PvP093]|uniref:Uncharacterized protein n=1 Tax=Stenotrophomonas pavanii TaxID=487698 RepID=A0A2D0ANV7_9GAMM|nr:MULTISPECIES: hypothetical protein [Stenotrophomonas]MBP2482882.1 hypothetical protein [Stenotrophomonas sp. PvP093]OWR35251.1 hypothetical protein CEE55_02265 [Stenotrophomonas pavanii]DAH87201.1 MAG TPA: tail fiber protein [Caudoviricetes sp.]